MKISVVVPAFNSEKTIIDSLKSILNQGFSSDEIEIIIINDGSSDFTVNKINYFKNEYDIYDIQIIDQENYGVATARNNGVKLSSGDYIAFLDSDDIWMPGKLRRQVDFMRSNPDYVLCGSNFDGLNANFDGLKKIIDSFYCVDFEKIIFKNYFQPSTVLMKRNVFFDVGGFKNGMRYSEDALLFYNICYQGKCAIDSKVSIIYGGGKHAFSSNGLASNLLKMEIGELSNYISLVCDKKISKNKFLLLFVFSLLKFFRRLSIKTFNKIK
ncbi:glycosyltransferase family 2 protein [Pectobacterium parvum]|uniref:glycosyltransferase family 2 protein n=1 Tax=Pectobacterium TaxID=122277 RepID=UPI001E48CEAC|nr:glycosyltransferase family A protein [Pectobacterium parvum]UFK40601.1 glycosyltransferase family 2 protein [Pectobacterium parvum]